MNRLSDIQQGVIGQYEFAKLMILGSNGQLEVDEPLSDDERRDVEIHRRSRFRPSLAFQVKTTRGFVVDQWARYLSVRFNPRSRVVTDRAYWYFFAHLDLKAMTFSDPVFLVPSKEVHKHCCSGKPEDLNCSFLANMEERARDRWVPYRVARKEVGNRVLDILGDLRAQRRGPALAQLEGLADVVWVGRRGR